MVMFNFNCVLFHSVTKYTNMNENLLKEHIVRIRISRHLYKRFKILCAVKDLSMPKQTAELIRKFVEVQEENDKKLSQIKSNNGL